MSARPKLLFPFAALLLVILTLTVGLILIEGEERDFAFWITLAPILLAEGMLGLSAAGIGGEQEDCLPLFRAGSGMAAVSYLGFTLIMLIPYAQGCYSETLLVIQSAGLLFWLALQVLIWLADRDDGNEPAFIATGCNKTGFALESAALLSDLKTRCSEQTELIRESGRLAEAARFAAESVKGSEQIDKMICTGLGKLRISGDARPQDEMRQEMQKLQELLRNREEIIRNLR